MKIIHHHLLLQADVRNVYDINAHEVLQQFLFDLVKEIDMEILIKPQLVFSNQKAWTGLVGIVTSHISFHYWTIEKYLQLDIYSCKAFSPEKAVQFVSDFWSIEKRKALFIEREPNMDFKIKQVK